MSNPRQRAPGGGRKPLSQDGTMALTLKIRVGEADLDRLYDISDATGENLSAIVRRLISEAAQDP
jgi:hypothetical protein